MDPSPLDTANVLWPQPSPADNDSSQNASSQTIRWDIDHIIQEADREPWTGVGQSRALPGSQARLDVPSAWSNVMGYRGPVLLSDDGTESAMGEVQFQSVDDMVSLAGSRYEIAEAAQIRSMLGEVRIGSVDSLNQGPAMPSMAGPGSTIDAPSTFSTITDASTNSKPLKCGICHETFSNGSKFRKHQNSHRRPYRCNVAECDKSTLGFANKTDLKRHKDTVHKQAGVLYMCRFPDCQTSSKNKLCSRKDNFRTHLAKMHNVTISTDELDSKYVKIIPVNNDSATEDFSLPEMEQMDSDTHVAESITIMDTDSKGYQTHEETMSTVDGSSFYQTYDPTTYATSQHGSFQGVNSGAGLGSGSAPLQTPQSSLFALPVGATNGFSMPGPRQDQQYMLNQTSVGQAASTPGDSQLLYSPRGSSIFSSSMHQDSFTAASSQPPAQAAEMPCHNSLVNEGCTDSQLIEYLGSFPTDLLKRALQSKDGSMNESSASVNAKPRGAYSCPQCKKTCNRACELRKHMKRHERPYACTVKNCGKYFGSKNDWKRHESGQHHPSEAWACDEEGCTAILGDRLAFSQHLVETHEIRHDEDVQSKTQNCRIGRPCDRRFWCGFCRRVVEVEMALTHDEASKESYWNRRFDHIDAHLFGKLGLQHMSKGEWRYLEDAAKHEGAVLLDHVSTTESVRSSNTNGGAAYKRKGSEQTNSRPYKRTDTQWATS